MTPLLALVEAEIQRLDALIDEYDRTLAAVKKQAEEAHCKRSIIAKQRDALHEYQCGMVDEGHWKEIPF